MEEELNTHIIIQLDNYEKIRKASNNFKASPKKRITETYVTVRIEQLQTLWEDFQTKHKELMLKYCKLLMETEYIKNDIYNTAEEAYIDYQTDLKSVLHLLKSKTKDAEAEKATKVAQVKLPKIIIPTFSGKYTEWITFRDMFVSMVHSNATLDNVQKMHYLKCYLTGEAEQLLRQIPISDANYERCWTLLTERYDNKRFLSHFILKRMLSQRNITVESSNSLKELMDTTNDCLNGLLNLGINTKSWDIIVIHILTLKLDPESRKQWEFYIVNENNSQELPTFTQFQEFLTNRYKALEFLDTKSSGTKFQPNTQNQANQNVPKFKSLHVSKLNVLYVRKHTN
ncbi:hypothetical protein NE865_03912 [Phthorimaea operculella]|nr:hypothetical protein NE865_03912 [Phthorimaea operculella]